MSEGPAAGSRGRRGLLRVYLGAAPGVGKTFAMLDEGWRRKERGTDVVVGFVETHRRAHTQAQMRDLEVIPRRSIAYRGSTFSEMDVDAVLARRPAQALVDELAHTNVPGSRNEKRWQDVDELLDAGIDVITTVNVQHLESLNDVIEGITGVRQRETVPDAVVRRADQIELVDMSPEALRRRMAHGNIYPAERVDAALANYFRPGNLSALRELALLWVADRVEENLQQYMETHDISASWETRERVVVAVTGAPGGEQLVRRAARITGRLRGGLMGVHVLSADGLETRAGPALEGQRQLLEQFGGTYREVVGERVSDALVDFARSEKATQVVIGATRRSRWHELMRGSVVNAIVRRADGFDVHVIAEREDEEEESLDGGASASALGAQPGELRPGPDLGASASARRRSSRYRRRLPARRKVIAVAMAVVGLPLLTAVLASGRSQLTLATDLLLLLVATVAIAVMGGTLVGVLAAVEASLLANWFFVEPRHTLTISDPENVVALGIFVLAAVAASVVVERIATRSREALQARAEAEALARTSSILIGEPNPLPDLLDHLRTNFGLEAVSLLSNRDDGWVVDASSGPDPPGEPFDGERWDLTRDGSSVLVLRGAKMSADDQRVLRTFLSNLALALRSRRLQAEAAMAAHLSEADQLRTALLQAVSHDLRTPLASIKASATSLLQSDVSWDAEQRREFAQTIDDEADRLNRLVGNLLDMSRLNAGALSMTLRPVFLEDVVAGALASIDHDPRRVLVSVPETLPAVHADPALLERALANIVANALAWSPPGAAVSVEGAEVAGRVHLRIIDRGPGVLPRDRDKVFQPFQRLGDRSTQAGVGLGLAVARGFIEAVGGTIELDDTPGGGLTVGIDLVAATPEGPHPAGLDAVRPPELRSGPSGARAQA
jgi:two-component system sensor histidine kinase KdpD